LKDVPPDQPDLRASDADRDATGERLRIAASEGRLDPFELEARLSAAYGARYCSELARLTADVTPPAPLAPAPPAPTFVRRGPRTNGLAVASMVIGLVWAWWVGSLLAIAFGHVALRQIAQSGGEQKGRGFAVAGLALGYFGALTLLFALLSFAV
jgi:uncharacterized protein DUF4190/uncharacterized protein DUF1707